MKQYLLILLFLTFEFIMLGQDLPIIKPTVGIEENYDKESQILWQKALDWYFKDEYGQLDEQGRKLIDSLESGYGPLTQGVGCSWYCGGGPYEITASSHLKEQGEITYSPNNAHDFNLFTAWIPDKKNGAIGAKIHFHFEPFRPRVNEITIWNGYIKNTDLWKANSRVAKFRLFINGEPTAILELNDINNSQSFKIDPVQSTDSTKDLILTLEILEIYKGTKYDDIAISEINFNGLDVHCFGAGTKVTMADSSTKDIELITKNDWILTFNNETKILVKTQVSELIQVRHSNLLKLKFSDREVIVTDDHPFWTAGKKWASINPLKSNSHYEQEKKVAQLKVGDSIFLPAENKYIELMSIETVKGELMTYTIELTTGNSFTANGLLVKTEKLKPTN